ncbi:MAG: hypothetical protein JNK58_09380 [Phycisphaerae bacterium]|nr:hypothetical protein [Phycisphaerae bacterium]
MKRVLGVLVFAASASSTFGETFTVPINPAQSSITATLTLQGRSDDDTSPVAGTVRLNLATVNTPAQVTGIDFDLQVVEPLDFFINYGFGSTFSSTVTGLRLMYAAPGTPIGPVPVAMGGFTFLSVPANTQGLLTYTATGLVCLALGGAGLPCTDMDDLSTEPTQPIDFAGTVTVGPGRLVTVISTVDRTTPIDPANPSLGTLRVQGTIRGSVLVPVIAGDANGDCVVDFSDITSVLSHYGGGGAAGDADNSGTVDFADITSVLSNWGAACG